MPLPTLECLDVAGHQVPGLVDVAEELVVVGLWEPQFISWVVKICWRRDRLPTPVFLGFPCGSAGKESACNAGGLHSIPGL